MSVAGVSNSLAVEDAYLKCGACQLSTAALRCAVCHIQKYCNVTCQKAHWPAHKQVCQILKAEMREMPTPIPGLRLVENVVSAELHDHFVQQMKRGISEQNVGHYDGYSFTDEAAFDRAFDPLIKELRSHLSLLRVFDSPVKLVCTLIGYEKEGYITKHIDHPLVSGDTVVVISFNSPVVVNFYSEKGDKEHHKLFVPPRSMYAIKGEARYKWSHAILSDENTYQSQPFDRGVRFAIVLTPPGTMRTGLETLEFG
ncbi:MAG: hypothetical protein S4CHLAM2_15560 [Chlamydiales bacterium]|nr:hypothetical protein [Chlamydiales bacterium]